MKATTPLASELPLAAERVELPPLLASVTVLPWTGLPLASLSVMVIVEEALPLAATAVGLALTVDWAAETVPGFTVNAPLLPAVRMLPLVRVAVRMTPLSALV